MDESKERRETEVSKARMSASWTHGWHQAKDLVRISFGEDEGLCSQLSLTTVNSSI